MSQLSNNVRAIQIAADSATEQARQGRNNVLRDYYAGISPGAREDLTYIYGTQVYKDKTLEQFLKLIDKRSVKPSIQFVGGDDNDLLASAFNDISNMVYARALSVRDTGRHVDSITHLAREVGSRQLALISSTVRGSQLPERAVLSIVPTVAYASTLESRGVVGGILYHVAKQARAKYGSRLSIRYDYISGKSFGLAGGTFPRIQVAHYGNLRKGLKTPGRSTRRRRGYAQAKGRSR